MPRPVVSTTAEDLYARLGPWRRKADEIGGSSDVWQLLELCEAIATKLGLDQIEGLIRDSDDGPGWSAIMDVDRAPSDWLAWLAQFGGVRIRPGLSDADQRAWIKSTDGYRRGSPGAIVGAAQRYLTGTKTVYLVERHGSAYRLTVTTLGAETPSIGDVTRAVRAQKPAGIVLTVTMSDGGDYLSLRDTHASYTTLTSVFSTYAEVLSDPTQQ